MNRASFPSTLHLAVFSLVMLLYLAYPWYLIHRQERILERGTAFRFELQPVDPVDAFRGRYLALNYRLPSLAPPPDARKGQTVFLTIREDPRGYAHFDAVLTEAPADRPYVRTTVLSLSPDRLYFDLPENMDRFYLNEQTAPLAEAALQKLLTLPPAVNTEVPAYAVVRILDGRARIEQLFFDGLPLREYLERKS